MRKQHSHLHGVAKGHSAASVPSMTPSTFAQVVALPLMELGVVLEHRQLKALTPYHPDVWEYALQEAGLLQKYPHIVTGLHFGFNISFPPISTTQAPPNKESIVEFTDKFNKIVHNEMQKGCYIGLISGKDVEALIGPFQSSPFSINPKPG